MCLWLQRIRGALSCTASLQVCGERVFLRSFKESVNRSTAGAVLPRRGSLAAGAQRTGDGRGPEQSDDAAAHGGLQGAVVGRRVGTPVCAEPEALQAVPCGVFPSHCHPPSVAGGPAQTRCAVCSIPYDCQLLSHLFTVISGVFLFI